MLDLCPCRVVPNLTLCHLTVLNVGVADSEADGAMLTQLQQQVAELQSANAELKEEADSSWAELNAKEEVSGLSTSLCVQTAQLVHHKNVPFCDTELVQHSAAVSATQQTRTSAYAVTESYTCCCTRAVAAARHRSTRPAHTLQELDATTARLLQSEDRAARAQAQAQQAAAQTRDARAQAAQVSQTLQASLLSPHGGVWL